MRTQDINRELREIEAVWQLLTPAERETWHRFALGGGDAWALHVALLECKRQEQQE